MRSTLVLDDEVFRRAKKRAAELDLTLSEVANRALREYLKRPTPARPARFQMITYGDPGKPESHTPAEIADILADEDAGIAGR